MTSQKWGVLFYDTFIRNKAMTVSHEIKSQLAKLLATEDLVVEHKFVETACFNVHTRVLTLPMWEKASNDVLNMLVGHEVGHALYTPDKNWLVTHKIPPQFVNIVEDVRIEKMMKRRYAGIHKTFYRGYQELADQDFFCIENENVNTMNLADKANLYFKIGSFVDIDFTNDEKVLIKKISETETFDDVLNVAEQLFNFCKEQQESKTKTDDLQTQNNQSGEGGEDEQMTHEEMLDEADRREMENEDQEAKESENSSDTPEEQFDDLDVKTMGNLEESLKDLIGHSGNENNYVELPELNLQDVIISNSVIHQSCDDTWNEWAEINESTKDHIFEYPDSEYQKFKKSSQKEVNYLVKEFECKKAADSYARATTARTGVLDCSKLHTYKYNEDLFKKVTTLADGKNHGLVFVLDWSGSMCDVMLDTIKQLYNLMWFCKKVSIPFEVYAFTNDYPHVRTDENGKVTVRDLAYQKREGLVYVGEWFSMMNLFTSKVDAKTLEYQMKNIFRIASTFRYHWHCQYPTPPGLGLSGTPLNEAMISLHQIIPQFKNEHKLQKVQCVVLSDGEGAPLKFHRQFDRRWEDEPFLGTNSIGCNSFLRDRKTGHTYSFDCEWHEMTDVLLHNLRDRFVDVNFIGVRVLEPRDANSFIRRYTGWGKDFEKLQKVWKKQKAFSIHQSGYHTYFGISANALSQSTEFSPGEDATKSQIKTAFVKSLRTKKMNKKVLGEFIELIA